MLTRAEYIAAWWRECVEPEPDGFVLRRDLVASFNAWAGGRVEVGSARPLLRWVREWAGVAETKRRQPGGYSERGITGIRLRADVAERRDAG
ncbi:MAG: hypothetical protein OXC08_20820 [Thiotrichales bacterium]|nr:hypothetical protein [Thiotrichales bacterium]